MPDATSDPGMTLDDEQATAATVVGEVERLLETAGIVLAAREARDMVAALLDQPRFWVALHRGEAIAADVRRAALRAARLRARGAPFAYAVGRASFRHMTLAVDPRVLIPRQETEQLVDLVLERRLANPGGTAVDVGTGSGAIALALATEGRFDRVIGTDISRDALAVAQANANTLQTTGSSAGGSLPSGKPQPDVASVEFRHGSLLGPVRDLRVEAVVSNPPYIAYGEAEALPASVRDWEPAVALLSGNEGLAVTSAIIREAAAVLVRGGLLALEVDVRRAALVAELAATDGRYEGVSVELDLTGRERFVLASRV